MTEIETASFATRRDAEMAVERIVQEYRLDPHAVSVHPIDDRDSSGTKPGGGDLETVEAKPVDQGRPHLKGRLVVSAKVEAALAEKVRSSFAAYGGQLL